MDWDKSTGSLAFAGKFSSGLEAGAGVDIMNVLIGEMIRPFMAIGERPRRHRVVVEVNMIAAFDDARKDGNHPEGRKSRV